jgi:glycosyltransferase involved in cell wall biosynthesis
MPWLMLWNLRRSPLADTRWDGVVWYSPSIFHGPLVSALKRSSRCRAYLIIRDIFPEWAVDVGLMGRGVVYRFFDAVARYQYSVADVIGVQTHGNRPYFDAWVRRSGRRLEVLPNWLGGTSEARCSIRVSETRLSGRKIFVYAGNMGVAQGVGVVLALADRMRDRRDVGFLFVGRGSEAERLKSEAASIGLGNVSFFDEIDPDEIPDLYAQCSVGLVVLDPRHRSHNIPGKFLTYMQGGLPVLALVNPGNDISSMIRDEKVGQVSEGRDMDDICALAGTLLDQIESDAGLPDRCRALFVREFSVESAAVQVAAGLGR